MRKPLSLAVVPPLVMGFLVWEATREDEYAADGRSYWETHADAQAMVILAGAINLGVLITLFIVRGGGRAEWAVAICAVLFGVFAAVFALLALSAH